VNPAEREATAAIVRLALSEDVGDGDATTLATVDPQRKAEATVTARAAGVLSGLAAARETARQVDPSVRLDARLEDGAVLRPGETVALLTGAAASLLTMERTLLNFLQRLSGVASLTAAYVHAVAGTGAAIVDTRKTTPGLRLLEKAAVRHGGGNNHRLGLFDAFMVKDNHIEACGGLTRAVEKARRHPQALYLTVEARTEAEVEEAAGLGVDQILLDNMSPERLREAVRTVRRIEGERGLKAARLEASGGITLANARRVAESGVDLISVGALTHSAPALDLAMKIRLLPGDGPGA
jgi:nicotinate-nucleotide pyrophosphorylase (carboxylating)